MGKKRKSLTQLSKRTKRH